MKQMKKLKITIKDEFTDNRITIERPATGDLEAMLHMLEAALRGLGFNFEGHLEIVEDEK
jgi:hypothetical protein